MIEDQQTSVRKRQSEKQITKDDNFDDDHDTDNDDDNNNKNGGTWTPASAEVMVIFIKKYL